MATMDVHICAQTGNLTQMKEILLAQPSLINSKASGRTPLHWACSNAKIDMIQWLVTNGADTEALNNIGKRPIDLTPGYLRARVTTAINEALEERLTIDDEDESDDDSTSNSSNSRASPQRPSTEYIPGQGEADYPTPREYAYTTEYDSPEALRPEDVPRSPPPIVMDDLIPPPPPIEPDSPLYRAWARRNRTPVHAMALAFQHLAYVGAHAFGHPDREEISRYFRRPPTPEEPDAGQLGDAARSEWRRMNDGSWRRAPVLPLSDEAAFERRQLWGELRTSLSRRQSRRHPTRRRSESDILTELADQLVDDAIIDAELEALLREQEDRFESVRKQVLAMGIETPDEYICPIGMEIMLDPVVCADGFSYERTNIARWLTHNVRSPKTNLPLEWRQVIPNRNLKIAIDGFLEGHAVKARVMEEERSPCSRGDDTLDINSPLRSHASSED